MNSGAYGVLFLLLFVGYLSSVSANVPSDDWSNFSKNQIQEINQRVTLERKVNELENLILAKKFLINGDTELAKYFLNRINTNESDLKIVIDRYKAWIYFIDGDYEETQKILSKPEFNDVENFREICLLKSLSKMVNPLTKEFEKELIYCQVITRQYSKK